jgi:hypothetical protein
MGDLNIILVVSGIKGERALVLILNHYMKDENKIKNQINNNNKLNIK